MLDVREKSLSDSSVVKVSNSGSSAYSGSSSRRHVVGWAGRSQSTDCCIYDSPDLPSSESESRYAMVSVVM